jgi:hypothetical protein
MPCRPSASKRKIWRRLDRCPVYVWHNLVINDGQW